MGVVAFLFDLPVIGHTHAITDGWGISFLMQAWWMFCICSVVFITTSLCTPPPPLHAVEGLIWTDSLPSLRNARSWNGPLTIASLLLLAMVVLYVIFR
jgi:SSS family solute:Na+ symporter